MRCRVLAYHKTMTGLSLLLPSIFIFATGFIPHPAHAQPASESGYSAPADPVDASLSRSGGRSRLQPAADGKKTAVPPTGRDTIVVEANSAGDDNATTVARDSRAATKLNTPLIKTDRSVSVITRREMEQRGVQDTVEAVRYSAGVTTGPYGFDPRFDQIYIRGYSATTMGDYKDGLRQPYLNYGMFRTDPYSLERTEIVKGPVSVLYGAGTPAGIVNKVSKFADGSRIREAGILYGTKNRKQFAFDVADALGENGDLSYRLVGLAREGETNFDIADNRYFLQPSLTWTPSDRTSLTVYSLVQNSESDASVSAITDAGGQVRPFRSSDPDYDHQKTRQQQVGYEFEHYFNNLLTFRQNLRYSHLNLHGQYLSVNNWTGTVAHRYPWEIRDELDVFQVDTQLEWAFDTGALSHTLLTGFDYTDIDSSVAYGYGAVDSAFDFDIANPSYGVSGPTGGYGYYQADADLRQSGLYAMDQIALGNWHFTLGGRHTWVEQNRTGLYPSSGVPIDESLKKDAFTTQAGLLYAFDNGLSPFANYATSFEPVTNRSASGDILAPTKGEQFELGMKYQPPGSNILLSATTYHLVEKNKPVLVDATALTYRALGEVTNKGVELEARANITDGWDIITAYTYAHSRITAGDDNGNSPAVTPEHAASLWVNHTFAANGLIPGLSAGAGLRYTGSNYTSTANTTKNDAAYYLDATLSYNFGAMVKKYDGLTVSLSARNIADHRDTVCNEGYCYLGQERNITASLKYRW